MKSNTELCSKVAELVFGWHRGSHSLLNTLIQQGEKEYLVPWEVWADTEGKVVVPHIDQWHPDTDWGQMGMVIKEMAGKGFVFSIHGEGLSHAVAEFVKWDKYLNEERVVKPATVAVGTFDEIPKAVCEAAVEALEER